MATDHRKPPERAKRRAPLAVRALRKLFGAVGPLAPRLMGRFAFWLWFRPSRRVERPAEAAVISSATPLPITQGRSQLATYSWGEGPAVLLVHGWNSSAAQLTAFVEPLLSKGYRVVAFDAPAHGRSAGRRSDAFEISNALLQIARRVGDVEAVVAHSMGVLVSARAMHAGGLNARRVVCLAPAVDKTSLVNGFASIMRLPSRVAANLDARVDRFTGGMQFWSEAIISSETLVLYDREDPYVPPSHVEALAERWPRVQLRAAETVGHSGLLTDPHVVAAAVEFIAGE